MTEAASTRDAVLVSTEWLQANLDAPELCVVDVRGEVRAPGHKPRYLPKRAEYDAGHIPGAVFVDWTRDIVDLDDPVPVQVATPDKFAARMGELGIGDGTLVVAYDDYKHIFAGRLSWVLRHYGHESVRVLDGGFARWVTEKRPLAKGVPTRARAHFTVKPQRSLRRSAEDVMAALGRSDVLLVDARDPDQYAGAVSAAGRGGHIPGARNVHYARLLEPTTGEFLSPPELARVFGASGVDVASLPPEIIVYCNGGVSCTTTLNALRLLGRDDVAVYDGSWNEWGNDPVRPIRQGAEP